MRALRNRLKKLEQRNKPPVPVSDDTIRYDFAKLTWAELDEWEEHFSWLKQYGDGSLRPDEAQAREKRCKEILSCSLEREERPVEQQDPGLKRVEKEVAFAVHFGSWRVGSGLSWAECCPSKRERWRFNTETGEFEEMKLADWVLELCGKRQGLAALMHHEIPERLKDRCPELAGHEVVLEIMRALERHQHEGLRGRHTITPKVVEEA